MATQTDVYNALMQLIKTAAYPDGLNQPSVAGIPVMVISGWPSPKRLDALLSGEAVTVSVYKVPNMEKATVAFASNWQTVEIVEPTLIMTVNGDTITIEGTASPPQNCLVRVNDYSVHYKVKDTDTPSSIAAALAALIGDATAYDNLIVVDNAYRLRADVSVQGTAIKEVNRQEAYFYLTVWAASEAAREAVANAILVAIGDTLRLNLPYGETARIKYHNRRDDDKSQKVSVLRTDIIVSVEYAITQIAKFYTITDVNFNVSYVPVIT